MMQQPPQPTKAEKIVNALADGVIWSLQPLVWLIRLIRPPNWMKQDRSTPNKPLNEKGLNNNRGTNG